ncbi:hypothetical protein IWX90DRAFT_11683 [Phyllosticta citrichinensis]|uniref:Uncharacterized protein n=1 Tax=Phyllosticta citrichinensis TaxID=1130410 RepID=A0ABR1Y607_9PEZI
MRNHNLLLLSIRNGVAALGMSETWDPPCWASVRHIADSMSVHGCFESMTATMRTKEQALPRRQGARLGSKGRGTHNLRIANSQTLECSLLVVNLGYECSLVDETDSLLLSCVPRLLLPSLGGSRRTSASCMAALLPTAAWGRPNLTLKRLITMISGRCGARSPWSSCRSLS